MPRASTIPPILTAETLERAVRIPAPSAGSITAGLRERAPSEEAQALADSMAAVSAEASMEGAEVSTVAAEAGDRWYER